MRIFFIVFLLLLSLCFAFGCTSHVDADKVSTFDLVFRRHAIEKDLEHRHSDLHSLGKDLEYLDNQLAKSIEDIRRQQEQAQSYPRVIDEQQQEIDRLNEEIQSLLAKSIERHEALGEARGRIIQFERQVGMPIEEHQARMEELKHLQRECNALQHAIEQALQERIRLRESIQPSTLQ